MRFIISIGKNDFAKVSKNLDIDMKIILLVHQNNYVGNLSMTNNTRKSFDIPAWASYIIILIVQENFQINI